MNHGILKKGRLLMLGLLLLLPANGSEKMMMKKSTDKNGKEFLYAENDPFNVRIYTLPNGMKLYLSKNPAKVRVNVMTVVRAGSVNDPENSTGLAHYFEHMMFKGTARMGSLDWAKEKPLLDQISDLFEKRKNTRSETEKKKIYAKIDRLSSEAAKYALPGEFSKLVSSIGGSNLNAGTSHDYTVYYGEIPANELGKYLKLDAERFSSPVLRLFHTELETVYEEFNIYQDKDSSRAYALLRANLFPDKDPRGREIIGYADHLKNPSMKDIEAFYCKWYVPCNMALLITGDIDYEKTYKMVLSTFGKLPEGKRPPCTKRDSSPLGKSIVKQLSGPEPASVLLGWRLPRTQKNALLLQLVQRLLSDNDSGLLDRHLLRAQKILNGNVFVTGSDETLIFMMKATPRRLQTLEEAAKLLLAELERIRKGDYEDWRIRAVADNLRVEMENMKNGDGMDILYEMADSFLADRPYSDTVSMPDDIAKLTKKDVSDFVSENLKHFVRIDKLTGKPLNRIKVAKPKITPVTLNFSEESAYAKEFLRLPAAAPLKPEFINPKTAVEEKLLPGNLKLVKVKKSLSKTLFHAKRTVSVGKYDDLRTALALDFLDYAGSSSYSPDALREEFYKLGLRFEFSSDRFASTAELSGPAEHFKRGTELLDHFIRNAKADKKAWKNYVDGILKQYADEKLKPQAAFFRTVYYAWHGKTNPMTYLPPEKMLRETDPAELLSYVRELFTEYPSALVVDGPVPMKEITEAGKKLKCSGTKALPKYREFRTREIRKPKVYLVDFDTVQLRIGFSSRAGLFSVEDIAPGAVFNEYFCQGLDAVVFQEIRESRGLAYAAGGAFALPMRRNAYDMIYMLLGTQPDKLFDASSALQTILKKMPLASPKFQSSKEAVLKSIATERIYGTDIYFFLKKLERMGISGDYRRKEYETISKMTLEDLEKFFNTHLRDLKYDILIVGRTKKLDRKKLSALGEVTDLSLKDIYGY